MTDRRFRVRLGLFCGGQGKWAHPLPVVSIPSGVPISLSTAESRKPSVPPMPPTMIAVLAMMMFSLFAVQQQEKIYFAQNTMIR